MYEIAQTILNDPVSGMELAAIALAMLCLINELRSEDTSASEAISNQSCYKKSFSKIQKAISIKSSLLTLFNVGELISQPKRSLQNQHL